MRPSSLRLSGGAGQQVLQRVLQKRREVACDGDRLRLRTRQLSVAIDRNRRKEFTAR